MHLIGKLQLVLKRSRTVLCGIQSGWIATTTTTKNLLQDVQLILEDLKTVVANSGP